MKAALRLIVAGIGLAAFNLSAATLYVSLESTNPTPPYTSWGTAATNIQHAIDAAVGGDEVVVTNGVYAAGGVAVDKPLILRSVNGPQYSAINGGGTTRCVWLADGASLSGFTLTNGHVYNGDAGGWGGVRIHECLSHQLHAHRQLGQPRGRGLPRHPLQLHADRQQG